MPWKVSICALLLSAMLPLMPIVAPNSPDPYVQKGAYRLLEPIKSGEVVLYPIARTGPDTSASHWRYITLDQGLKTGDVIIEETGKARGLVRRRSGNSGIAGGYPVNSGAEVNRLVLENNSDLPLLLLAGEIVTGGKQDRIIGKDRIVPPHSDPLDLDVFCIEPHRWVEQTASFNGSSDSKLHALMVEPSVRAQAMVKKDQMQVWDAVNHSVATEQAFDAKARLSVQAHGGFLAQAAPATSSYAKTMASPMAAQQVDALTKSVIGDGESTTQLLLKEHAVGVLAAVHGHIVWADVFATPDMLAAYWTKLVRSYAAESLHHEVEYGPAATNQDVLQFLNANIAGEETSEGNSALYRYREVRGSNESIFTLELLTATPPLEVHRTWISHGPDQPRSKAIADYIVR